MFDMIFNILKNFTTKPATRKYPFDKREIFKNVRGKVRGIDIEKCIFCGLCSRKCPSSAISVNKTEKSWEIDPYRCIICGACEECCPKKCIIMDEQHSEPNTEKQKIKVKSPVS